MYDVTYIYFIKLRRRNKVLKSKKKLKGPVKLFTKLLIAYFKEKFFTPNFSKTTNTSLNNRLIIKQNYHLDLALKK